MIQHDSNGFLVGQKAMASELDKIAREVSVLKAIQADTRATVDTLGQIANALSRVRPSAPAAPPQAGQGAPRASSPRRSPGGRPLPPMPVPSSSSAPPEPGRSITPRPPRPRAERDEPPVPGPAPAPRPPRPRPTPTPTPDAPPERDEKGRFKGKGSKRAGGAGSDDHESSTKRDPDEKRQSEALGAVAESLKNAASGIGEGADQLDPTVTAAKELGGLFSPVVNTLKPLGKLFRRSPEDKNQRESVSWYRKIWMALRNPKEPKEKSSGALGLLMTGLMSLLGMLMSPLKALSRMLGITSAAGKVAGAIGSAVGGFRRRRATGGGTGEPHAPGNGNRRTREGPGGRPGEPGAPAKKGFFSRVRDSVTGRSSVGDAGASGGPGKKGVFSRAGDTIKKGVKSTGSVVKSGAKGLGSLAKGAGGLFKSLGKGLFKSIPMLGSLLEVGSAIGSAFAPDDPNKSAQENKTDRWGGVGAGVGGLIGGAVGMLGGPAGAIAGGMIGDQLGEMFGKWLSTVDMDGAIKGMSAAWSSMTDAAGKAWNGFTDLAGKAWDGLVSTGSKMFDSAKSWLSEKAQAVGDVVSDKVQTVKNAVSQGATNVKDMGQNALNTLTGGAYKGGSNAQKDQLIQAMDAGGITDPKSKAALMANVDHETGGFKNTEENLHYSAQGLMKTFPKYYKDADSARADANNPEAIANKVYGGRMGNTDPGDGYKYRGRGDIQLTGKDQYAAMGKKLGIDLVNHPELAEDPKYSAQIAVAHWKDSGADRAASVGDTVKARKLTNGGTNGLEDVQAKYDKYLPGALKGDLTPERTADANRVAAPAAAQAAIASTMAAVNGTPAVAGVGNTAPGAVGASGASFPGAAGVPGAAANGTVGIMAMAPATATASASATAMRSTITPPAMLPPLKMPSYSAPAADASQTSIPATPPVDKQSLASPSDKQAPAVQLNMPLTQNLDDRSIAHAATGGIGAGMGWM